MKQMFTLKANKTAHHDFLYLVLTVNIRAM